MAIQGKEILDEYGVNDEPMPGGKVTKSGNVSFYTNASSDPRWGGITKGGDKFDENDFTAAVLPEEWEEYKGKTLRVTNPANGKSVEVRVNDTGGFKKYGRVLDLSKAAFQAIEDPKRGTAHVKIEVVDSPIKKFNGSNQISNKVPSITQPSTTEFDPESDGYDIRSAKDYGIKPEINSEDGLLHWPTRVEIKPEDAKKWGFPEGTGMMLKGKKHKTWELGVKVENDMGYDVVKKGSRYWSIPRKEETTIQSDLSKPGTPKTPDQIEKDKARAVVELVYKDQGEEVPWQTKAEWKLQDMNPAIAKALTWTLFPAVGVYEAGKNILIAKKKGEQLGISTAITDRDWRELEGFREFTESPAFGEGLKIATETLTRLDPLISMTAGELVRDAMSRMTPEAISQGAAAGLDLAGIMGSAKILNTASRIFQQTVMQNVKGGINEETLAIMKSDIMKKWRAFRPDLSTEELIKVTDATLGYGQTTGAWDHEYVKRVLKEGTKKYWSKTLLDPLKGEAGQARISGPSAGGITHEISAAEQSQVSKMQIAGMSGVKLTKDVVAKDVFGKEKIYKAGEDIFIYKDPKSGKALVKDGNYGILQGGQVDKIENAGSKWGFAPEMEGVEVVEKGVTSPEFQEAIDKVKLKEQNGEITIGQMHSEIAAIKKDWSGNLSETKFASYQLPGGENYREVLIKSPESKETYYKNFKDFFERGFEKLSDPKNPSYGKALHRASELWNAADGKISVDEYEGRPVGKKTGNFKSSHWDEPNVLAHLRMNDRTTPDGKKVLFIEEIQSDWSKEGRRLGINLSDEEVLRYSKLKKLQQEGKIKPNSDLEMELSQLARQISNVPQHPLLKNWQELALKQALKEAVEKGYDYISWTTGEQQADRYDLSKQVDSIEWTKSFEDKKIIHLLARRGNILITTDKNGIVTVSTEPRMRGKKLDEVIGKDISKKILGKDEGSLGQQDLKIGGEWAKNLYDKQIPNILRDLTKGEIENIEIGKEEIIKGWGWEYRHGQYEVTRDGRYIDESFGTREEAQAYIEKKGTTKIKKKDVVTQSLKITPEIRKLVIGQPAGGGISSGQKPPKPPKAPTMTPSVPEPKRPEKYDVERPILNFPSPTFVKHTEYIQSLQLPKSSKIPSIRKQINKVRGDRLSGKITPQEANERVRDLNQQLIKQAQKERIAVRMTKEGKVKLSVRKSGTYVPAEFAEYKNFKDLKMVMGGGTDITRTIQGIDGALSVKQKVAIPGQAGPLERHVLWPTRDMTKNKIDWIKEQGVNLHRIVGDIVPKSKEAKALTMLLKIVDTDSAKYASLDLLQRPDVQEILARFPDHQKIKLAEMSKKLRLLYNDIWKQMNTVRAQMAKPDISYIEKYSPEQIRDMNIWSKVTGFKKRINDIMSKKAQLPDYVKPNAPFNPRAMARENGIPFEEQELDAVKLIEDYIVTASREMFNTPIIQNGKVFAEQLRTMGYSSSADTIDRWIAEAYANISSALDRVANLPANVKQGMKMFNRARNMGVFAWNFGWSVVTQIQSLAMTFTRFGTVDTFKGMIDWMSSPKLRDDIAKNYYSYVIKTQKIGRSTSQELTNVSGEAIKIHRSFAELADDVGNFLINAVEQLCTGGSIRAAQIHGAARGLTGRALQEFASDGGGKTQSMYNDEDKPGMLRSLVVKTGAPFQTFAFDMVNTCREWGNEVGTPPDDALERTKWILRFLVSSAVLQTFANKVAKKRFFLYNPTEMPIPFTEYWLSPLVVTVTGEWRSPTYTLASPIQTFSDMSSGMKDVIQTGSWRRLRRVMLRMGPGLFGVSGGMMLERIVDVSIAYSQGGIKDRKGKIITPVEDIFAAGKMLMFGSSSIRQEKQSKEESADDILKEFELSETKKPKEETADSIMAEYGIK